jgi:DNA-binding transcriptional ArsR family regulator
MKTMTTIQRLDRSRASEWAGWFRAIGDPTRVLILHLLSTEDRAMTVGEITDALDVGQSTISHHLAKLADVGFVLVEYVANSSLWRVNTACLAAFPSAAEMIMGRIPTEFTDALEITE